MVDIPGNSTTGVTVTVGSTTAGTLETLGDHDWYRIQLTAGQSISVAVNGVTLEDPFLRVRNPAGTVVYESDDISAGVNRDSLLGFTATSTGTYYLDVGGFNDEYAGTFQLVVSNYTPPPVGTVDQFATQLVTGYWGGESHRFAVTQGGSLTVNLTAASTAAGQNSGARGADAVDATSSASPFAKSRPAPRSPSTTMKQGAHADSIRSNGIISSSDVNVSTQWLTDYGTGLNGYAFQAYIHEIGHALGLGHAGHYNETARYPFDAPLRERRLADVDHVLLRPEREQPFRQPGVQRQLRRDADDGRHPRHGGSCTACRPPRAPGDTVYGSIERERASTMPVPTRIRARSSTAAAPTRSTIRGWRGNQLINLNAETFSNVIGEVGNCQHCAGRGHRECDRRRQARTR